MKTHANREGYAGRAYRKKNKILKLENDIINDSGPPVQIQIEVITTDGEEHDHFETDDQELPHFDPGKQQLPHFEADKQALPHFETAKQDLPHFETAKQEFSHFESSKHDLPQYEAAKQDVPHYETGRDSSGPGGNFEVVRLQLDPGGTYYDAVRPTHIEAGRSAYLDQQELKDVSQGENYVNQINLAMIAANNYSSVNKIDFYNI